MTARTRRLLFAVVALVLVAAAITAVPLWRWYSLSRFYETPQGRAGDPPVMLTVEDGQNLAAIARSLEMARVVAPASRFVEVAKKFQREKDLQAGDYRFDRPVSPRHVLELLSKRSPDVVKVIVPEGLALEEVAALVARAGVAPEADVLRAFHDPRPVAALDPRASDLEGYLLPGTYRFSKGLAPERVAAALVRAFSKRFAVPEAARIAASGRPLRAIVTLASLVEKETARPEERARIAGVFLARLARGMRLQCDPTVIFAARRAGTWDGDIRRADLERDDPYNTYVRAGLPPGPIASPGLASLNAALAPERTTALYFVARGDGSHVFTDTLEAHNGAVRRFQKK